MEDAGVPLLPGYHGDEQDPALLREEADKIGFPVLLKAVAGGGGKGMRRVDDGDRFDEELAAAQREASSFGDSKMLVEKFLTDPATWKSRCSATDTATGCTWLSETVRSSDATRR